MTALFAGLDVSMELTSVCVVDEEGRMVREAKVTSEPDAIILELRSTSGDYVRVGLEAGPLSQWLSFGLKDAELPVVCIEARHATAAMVAMNRTRMTATTPGRSLSWLDQAQGFLPQLIRFGSQHAITSRPAESYPRQAALKFKGNTKVSRNTSSMTLLTIGMLHELKYQAR